MKKQVLVIHGGDNYETREEYLNFLRTFSIDFKDYVGSRKDWKQNLPEALGPGYEVIRPDMPNKWDARYEEWKIWFEKFFPFLNEEVVLVGHSLGGTFLTKYLAENKFPKKVKGLFLVAACFGDNPPEYKLLDFLPPEDLSSLENQVEKIFLYHSKDDSVVPFSDLSKYQVKLPHAVARVFGDLGHFRTEQFPDLVKDIKDL